MSIDEHRSHASMTPGLGLSAGLAGLALVIEKAEAALLGRAWLEALVIAIVIGALVRTFRPPPRRFEVGIQVAGKTVLELAVALMGATVSFGSLAAVGVPLLAAIIATVGLAIALSYLIGRLAGLPSKMAVLIACGNAICGNSAIAAVAPVIDADGKDVAASIAFTAVLGIVVVIAIPIAAQLLDLSPTAAGILAGMTVYAVPQVFAAAGPLGAAAVQMGTLVKLVRVLMLGPVVTGLSLLGAAPQGGRARGLPLAHLAPPFILAFLGLAAVNSLAPLPAPLAHLAHQASLALTLIAMAALGLCVDLRSIRTAGPRLVLVVSASLALLGLIASGALRVLGVG